MPSFEIQDYDSGYLNDFGGGNVSWWHDYIRAEVGACNEYWRSVLEAYAPPNQSLESDGAGASGCRATECKAALQVGWCDVCDYYTPRN